MNTTELNLRKQNLIELVGSSDEEVIYEIEKCIEEKKSRSNIHSNKAYSIPANDNNTLAEPKFNTRYGHRFTQEELIATVNKAYQEAQNGECISNEEMHKEMEAWLKE